jgi:hypothetical protein
MISAFNNWLMWEIEDLIPMWDGCCKDLGIDPRLIKRYFAPRDERPDWLDYSDYPMGAACCYEGYCPEVLVYIYDFITGFRGVMAIRETAYHELIHVLLQEKAEEEEVEQLTKIISRRREGWRYCRSYLRGKAFECKLGPPQESLTLFQWAKRNKIVSGRPNGKNKP